MLSWQGLTFQNMMNFSGFLLEWMHDYTMILIVFILFMVGNILNSMNGWTWSWKGYVEHSALELLWTMFPCLVLLNMGYFSMIILYDHQQELENCLTIKITGHQWYWTYDYSDFKDVEFDSYMLPLEDLFFNSFRLLDVDNRTVIPNEINIRLIISSSDVLHSWAMPALGMKVDANPGRMNMINFFSNSVGVFFGQCSEICGANHSFMPICVESTGFYLFKNWILNV